MGTSYPTSRQTVVCRCALPRAMSAQLIVSGVVFSVCWFSDHMSRAVGPGRSSQLNLPRVCRIRVPSKLDVVRGVGVVSPTPLETPTWRQVNRTCRPLFLVPNKVPPPCNFL